MTDAVTPLEVADKLDEPVYDFFTNGWVGPSRTIQLGAETIRAQAAEIERLRDSVDGLNEDLYQAVLVAYGRGAKEWTALNYQQWLPFIECGVAVCPEASISKFGQALAGKEAGK